MTKTIENLGDPSVNFNPANASICEDAPADLLIDFNTTYKPNYSKGVFMPKSYEWSISGTGVTASDYAFTGGTNASSAFPKIIFKAYKTFAINVKVNGECNGNNEATFNLTLKETPVITNSNLTQSICSGTSTSAISLTSSVSGTTFTWEVIKSANITTVINGNSNTSASTIPAITINNNSTTSGTVTYRVTPIANGCTGSSKDFVITVNPTPFISNISETICSGYTFSKTPTDGNGNIIPSGTKYSWGTPVSNPTGAITGGSAQTNVSSISQTLTNITNTAATLTYTITPQSGTSGSCAGQPFTVIITVKPTPILTQPDNQTICNNLLTSAILFSSNVANTTFTWTNTNPTIGLSASGNGNIGSFKAINTGTTNQTATITVTPTANGCSGTARSFTITVNPTPQFSKQPESSSVCINGSAKTLSVAFANGTGTPSYQWFSNTTNSNTGGTEISGAINDSYAPTTNVVGTTYYYCV
ncbi:MAG: PKD-like domain-containing protein, partial [Paludibacter sp.]|nr:PKD-like domain-containing protein [Paludibacter sp.]